MNTITITVPMPPARLSPNGRAPRHEVLSSKQNARWSAKMAALHALKTRPAPRWKLARLSVVWFFTTKKRRDEDNLAGRLKSTIDGIRDAGIIADDSIGNILKDPPRCEVDKAEPRVEITISLLEG